jgi:phosphate/phosphite/phosphonate ABC transporter binding protein
MLKKLLLGAVSAHRARPATSRLEDLKEFRIGLIGGENEADRLRNYQCLVDQLLKAELGVEKVSLFPAADYDGTIQGLLGGTLDYAELGASGLRQDLPAGKDAVEPILTTVQTDGSTGYYSIMVARKDSGITKLEDLKGKKLGFADPDSTSGYLVPVVSLPEGNRRRRSRTSSPRPASAAAMRTSSSKCSRAPSTPARPSVRASASGKRATPPATCTRWSTRAFSTWTTSSKSGSRR